VSELERLVDGVAADLDWLSPAPVFVGGAAIGLFLDGLGKTQLRPTKDVDCIVPQVATRAAWWRLEEELRSRGWSPDPDGPVCRYFSPAGTIVDLMSADESVLGFTSRWYRAVVATAEPRILVTGRAVLVPTPILLLASKLEAWESRGRADPYSSKDLEDVAALLDGCRELEESVAEAAVDVRAWVKLAMARIHTDPATREVLLGQLPRGGDPEAQSRRVLALVGRLAGL